MAGDIIKVLLDGTSVPAKVKSHTIILKRSQSGRRFFNPKSEEVNEHGYRSIDTKSIQNSILKSIVKTITFQVTLETDFDR